MGNALSNREIAIVVWLAITATFALSRGDVCRSVRSLLRLLAEWKVWAPLLAFFFYMGAAVYVAARLGIWDDSMAKDTLVWLLGPAIVLLVTVNRAHWEERFFTRTALRVFELTAVLTFWVNLFVFSLPVELVLVPASSILALVGAYAACHPGAEAAGRLVHRVLLAVGLVLMAYAFYRTAVGWADFDWTAAGRTVALPAWLTVAALPFVFLLALVMGYELAFQMVDRVTTDGRVRRRVKAAFVTALHVRVRAIGSIRFREAQKAAAAPSFGAAWKATRRAASRSA